MGVNKKGKENIKGTFKRDLYLSFFMNGLLSTALLVF
jgi:hypothetical protein